MISINDYLHDPCGSLSIPYWKTSQIRMPGNMKILHQRNFSDKLLQKYNDEVYFRLIHRLQNIPVNIKANAYITTASSSDEADIGEIVAIINASYEDIKVDKQYVYSLMQTPVYMPSLWIFAVDPCTEKKIGCGIADYDLQCKEMILEWIQVLPEYRRKGIGKSIVQQLLLRQPKEQCLPQFLEKLPICQIQRHYIAAVDLRGKITGIFSLKKSCRRRIYLSDFMNVF